MSCNGCRVLRKGCSESCILRPCLQWIENPESQGHATVFVAKFFGRAGLMSFISAVPENQRPALFQSLLFEACGRTVNPVNGAVGLLWTGNWNVCQAAVETVLRGGILRPMTTTTNDVLTRATTTTTTTVAESDEVSEVEVAFPYTDKCGYPQLPRVSNNTTTTSTKRTGRNDDSGDLDLRLTAGFHLKRVAAGIDGMFHDHRHRQEKRRAATPSMNEEEESVTTSFDSGDHHLTGGGCGGGDRKLLNLFV